jgi:formate hydrogenlyase subunit 3/multisubunit Na+/H+ antiporter MnhD subunit
MNVSQLVTIAFGICVAGAIVTWILARQRSLGASIGFLATAISSVLVLIAAGNVLLGGPSEPQTLWALPQLGSALRIHVDGLSAIFLCLISTIALLASLYSGKYLKHYKPDEVGHYYPHFLLFVAGMYGIVTVTDLMFFFFAFWQLMTIPSYALVRFEHRRRENVRAANKYLLMMEISCFLVMLCSGLLATGTPPDPAAGAWAGKFDFESISRAMPDLLESNPGIVTIALLFSLVGFGIKAGMWPFGQMWLPDAHPAAPSPVSALLSGVMIKTGIYGLLRNFLWLVPAGAAGKYPSSAWGLAIAALGTVTLFVGTVQALKQEQSKRLLAFHSIGQVGYILLGLGVSLSLLGPGREDPAVMTLALLGLYGCLFHTINHGIFKSLLFLDAGSMLSATGTQDLNRLGGLARCMPLTAATTLVASFSIAGVPLLNGFASKWSIYSSAILGTPRAGYLAVFAIVAILTSALTLASFMKFFGVTFLSRRSTLVLEKVELGRRLEVGWTMMLPQIILAVLCMAFGLFPELACSVIGAGLRESPEGLASLFPATPGAAGWGLTVAGGRAHLLPVVILGVLAALYALAWGISRIGGSVRRSAPAWLCGYARESDAHRYGAHNLYGEVKRYLHWAGGVKKAH